MTKLNVNLLIKIKKHILDEPMRLRMDQWLMQDMPTTKKYNSLPGYNEPNEYEIPACGTVACLAGWAILLNSHEAQEVRQKDDPFAPYSARGCDILGIDSDIAPYDLFFVDQWPQPFQDDYLEVERNFEDLSPELRQVERAQIVGRLIDHFIEAYQDAEKTYNEA